MSSAGSDMYLPDGMPLKSEVICFFSGSGMWEIELSPPSLTVGPDATFLILDVVAGGPAPYPSLSSFFSAAVLCATASFGPTFASM